MLKILMLNKRKSELETQLEGLRTREEELKTREADLEESIEEAKTEEEIQVVNDEIDKFEKDKAELEEEKQDLETKIKDIDEEIKDLGDQEERTETTEEKTEERKGEILMETRTYFGGLTRSKVENLIEQRAEVKEFLVRTRELGMAKRSVTGADLLIPDVLIDIIRDNVNKYSKLVNKVNTKRVAGTSRVNFVGEIPEAVWTEACATLNELKIGFNQTEIDGYKVGGYIAICNATLEDASDVNLYDEIMTAIAQAIGLALDKAIVYGTGVKMPLGIVTRLAQAAKPENYSAKDREWVDLSTTNLAKTSETGVGLFQDLLKKSGLAKSTYATGGKTWLMNETTLTNLQAEGLSINAAGAIVSGVNNTMPVIGGEIVTLDFIPDGDIIGGYFSNYILAERAGMSLETSTHAQFIEDNTVFKGTARYDGKPVIAEAFVAININGADVTKTATFAPDEANKNEAEGV